MKYTAEEVRARVNKAWQNHDEQGRVFITMGDAMALVETILPERIEAAHVDPAAKPHTLADFVHAPDAERARTGQQVAARVDEMMAEPAARGELFGYVYQSPDDDPVFEYVNDRWSAGLRYGSYTETPVYADQPAQAVDVAKVRRVAADIRHWNEAICHPALNVFADELEAALQEKGNG